MRHLKLSTLYLRDGFDHTETLLKCSCVLYCTSESPNVFMTSEGCPSSCFCHPVGVLHCFTLALCTCPCFLLKRDPSMTKRVCAAPVCARLVGSCSPGWFVSEIRASVAHVYLSSRGGGAWLPWFFNTFTHFSRQFLHQSMSFLPGRILQWSNPHLVKCFCTINGK